MLTRADFLKNIPPIFKKKMLKTLVLNTCNVLDNCTKICWVEMG